MAGTASELEIWDRRQAIGELRASLRNLTDEDRSLCEVAGRLGIFCGGFRRWSDSEFHRRWQGLLGQSTHLSRPQMEQLANLWQLCEQVRHRVALACDAQELAPGACRGWGQFSNETIARFCGEILGRNVVVIGSQRGGQ